MWNEYSRVVELINSYILVQFIIAHFIYLFGFSAPEMNAPVDAIKVP